MRPIRLPRPVCTTLLKGALIATFIMASTTIHAQAPPDSDVASEETPAGEPEVASEKTPDVSQEESAQAEPAQPAPAQPKRERCLISTPERSQVTARLKKMRPKPAAKMLGAMSPELAADLLLRLDARQSARILNEMPARTGATLLTLLSVPTPEAP